MKAGKDEHNETKRKNKSICSAKRADQTHTAADRCDEQSAHYVMSAVAEIWSSRTKQKEIIKPDLNSVDECITAAGVENCYPVRSD